MTFIKTLFSIAVGAAFATSAVFAQDGPPSMSMISVFKVDPAKGKQFDDAWMTIREVAMENDYSYSEFAGGMRNERWIVTPINSYADVDAVMAARDALNEPGGKKMTKAYENFVGAMTESLTFFTHADYENSYQAEGDEGGSFMEIETYHFKYGKRAEMKSVFADYKALMAEKNAPYSYNVSWDGIGSSGSSVTVVTYAADAVAMAQRNAAMNELLDGDKKAEALFARFLAIAADTETMHTRFNAEASINLPTDG